MIEIRIPGLGEFNLEHLVLDVNGTLACDGHLIPGVEENLSALSGKIHLHLVTADTYGMQAGIDARLGLKSECIGPVNQALEKLEYVRRLGSRSVAAIGNGANDALMLKEAALGILVIGPEGASVEALQCAGIVVADIHHALELLLHPRRVAATLRR